MNSFTFEKSQRNFCFALMGIGLLSIILTMIGDDAYLSRFWSNFLLNSTFFTGIAFVALFVISAFMIAYAGWYVQFKRLWESFYQFLPVGLVLMLIIAVGLFAGYHELYEWNNSEIVTGDEIIQGKSGFLNKYWYTIGTLVIVGGWFWFFGRPMRKLSLAEDRDGTTEFRHHRKMKIYAAIFLPVAGFTSAALIWQWIMSLDPHWYSTLFAWYATASLFVATMALTVMMLYYLKGKGYFEFVSREHMHDIGKYVFAFSIFWTYLWFSQYMLIWYANVGEETVYFKERLESYPVLFYGNLIINFILPFFILMRNDTKRKQGTMLFIASVVFLGHWFDFFQMIKPGVAKYVAHLSHMGHGAGHGGDHAAEGAAHAATAVMAGFTYPGLLDIGTMLGFLGLFLFVALRSLAKAPLVPARDPYIQESLHHVVWYDDDAEASVAAH